MASSMEMKSVLSQLQSVASQAQQKTAEKKEGTVSFGETLGDALNNVHQLQKKSKGLSRAFSMGDEKVQLLDVMIASQKASLSFEALRTIRNKLVESYKQIVSMPI